jgi:hypothetical protein
MKFLNKFKIIKKKENRQFKRYKEKFIMNLNQGQFINDKKFLFL